MNLSGSDVVYVVQRMTFLPNTWVEVAFWDMYQATFTVECIWPDVRNPEKEVRIRRPFMISVVEMKDHGEEYVVAHVRQEIREMWLHEIDEWLTLDGERLVDTHGPQPG